MKKYLSLLLIVLAACSDDDEKILSDRPPFDDYFLALQFWHKPGTSTYEEVQAFNTIGKMNDSPQYSDDFYYFSQLNGDYTLPNNITLKVVTKESNIFRVEIAGALARWGTKVPASYTGNPELWNSPVCNFKIMVECNTSTEEIIAATYELWSPKFKSSEDITSAMRISNYEPYENMWSITSNDQPLIADAAFNISVRLVK